MQSGEISSSSSGWKIGLDELFVTYLNDNSESKTKPIKNYLDIFINIGFNNMSIRSRLVSQPKNKFISKSEQLYNVTDLLPITFGVNLPPNLHEKMSTNSQNNPEPQDENQNSKVSIIKYY